jgi:hypothetical protein
VAFKKPKSGELDDIQQTFNKAHNGLRAIGERGNALLKMTFRPLRAAQCQPGPVAAREDRRRSARDPPLRPHPHHMTAFQ